MITEIEMNILRNIEPNTIILHQVNCLGKMGAGLAAQLCKQYDGLWKSYHEYCGWFQEDYNGKSHRGEILGTWHLFKPSDELIICNAFGQEYIKRHDGECVTDYDAWHRILKKLERQVRAQNKTLPKDKWWKIRAPYNMGCGLGGGSWDEMLPIIKEYFEKSPVEFIICKH